MRKLIAENLETDCREMLDKDINHLEIRHPLISVVIATHNRELLLPHAVNSILLQTYSNFEIIIVNDCSTDGTSKVIDTMMKSDARIKALNSKKNVGPGAARNMGISHAQGEYIAIMDDDDVSLPYRIETEAKALASDPEIGLVSSLVEFVDREYKTIGFSSITPNGKQFPDDPAEIFVRLYLEGCFIFNPTIMARSEVWDKFRYPILPWDAEDRYLFMQMAAKGVKFKLIKQPLVKMLHDPNHQSLTGIDYQKRIPAKREVLRMIKEWLRKEGIHQFDSYHNIATSNQFLRESSHYRRNIKALNLIIHAFLISPNNPAIKSRFKSYLSSFIKS